MQGILSATGDMAVVKAYNTIQSQISALQTQINSIVSFVPVVLKATIPVNAWTALQGGGYEAFIPKADILNLDDTPNNWAMGDDDVFEVVPAGNTSAILEQYSNISAISVDAANQRLALYDREGTAPTEAITIRIVVLNPTLEPLSSI